MHDNQRHMQETSTIVIAGLAGVGKTAFLQAISEPAGLVSAIHRPVAGQMLRCELGHVTLRGAAGVRLLALPDAPSYRLADALPDDLLGVVVLVDAGTPDRLPRAAQQIASLQAAAAPFVVAVTRTGARGALTLVQVRQRLGLPPGVPMTACAVQEPGTVRAALILLLHHVIDRAVSPADE